MKSRISPTTGYLEFEARFVWWALTLAVFAGFALGAHVISVVAFNLPLGKGYYTYIQTHGHIQLMGWAGLFIVGISLHFIPRLAGVPLFRPRWIRWILLGLAAGLTLRFLSHGFLPYLGGTCWFWLATGAGVLSGGLELAAACCYVTLLIATIRTAGSLRERPTLKSVQPFFLMMLGGWLLYPTLNLVLLTDTALRSDVVLHPAWNEWALQAFLHLILFPVTFAFSIRMFPLYLRLPAIDWPVPRLAAVYLFAVTLQIGPMLPPLAALPGKAALSISAVGQALKGLAILWFVWKLDLFTRRRPPWTVERKLQPTPGRRPTREGLPDYGEFGRFERLVYAAYAWLLLGATVDIAMGSAQVFGWPLPISSDALRHTYLLGFVTHLILGMAVRMIPGFLHVKRVAAPSLVDATFWLGTVAAVGRVLPLLLPAGLFDRVPGLILPVQWLLGLSGVFGIAAVICLAINLRKTAGLRHIREETVGASAEPA